MQYSFTCPACGQKVTVDAANDEEAVNKLMAEGASHQAQAHAGQPAIPEDQMRQMVQSQMKKGDEQPVTGAPEGGQPMGGGSQPAVGDEQPASEGTGMPAAGGQENEEGQNKPS